MHIHMCTHTHACLYASCTDTWVASTHLQVIVIDAAISGGVQVFLRDSAFHSEVKLGHHMVVLF